MRHLLAALLSLSLPGVAAGQETEPGAPRRERPPVESSVGLRLGAFEMINSPDSYDAVFGSPMPQLGAQLEVRLTRRLLLGATLDYGTVEGERVLLTSPPRGTGVDEELTLIPLHLTAAWIFNPESRWRWHAGAGPSFLSWDEEGGGRSESGSEVGGSVVLGLTRPLRERWSLGGEARWSTFPNAVGESGVTAFFDEDDLGGLAVHVAALYRWR